MSITLSVLFLSLCQRYRSRVSYSRTATAIRFSIVFRARVNNKDSPKRAMERPDEVQQADLRLSFG